MSRPRMPFARRPLEPKWLTCQQVADALGMSLITVRTTWKLVPYLAKAARKLGRMVRFDAAQIAVVQARAARLAKDLVRKDSRARGDYGPVPAVLEEAPHA